ncbi:erythroid differentiation-related factor 1 isoform X1 [Fopius arisanus]|uniref:Erythroid differentiation-related factor 1 isoform X1 n=1 Tax=Fopius arisanus TaxID=64838 RepID=A0A9R1SW46_9HYME|nr:PREDICTED: erythroid differentiation-related factor 1 isoform X1 [Fopius arisanus]
MKNLVESSGEKDEEYSSDQLVKSVKSTAVVKYTAVQTPAIFAQLQCNTDLNHPPSNWLSSSAESYGLQSVWSHNSGFSSFRMAHMFPDCVGEVDVVSDAENIKKLLKMPYSHSVISMMVHRIENTLLLDDFDIHKYLLRQAETDWEWLKKFFYENIFEDTSDEKKSKLFQKTTHNSRNTLQQKNLVSKFLYHSLVLGGNELSTTNDNASPQNENKDEINVTGASPLPLQSLEPMLPEPTREDKLPDPNHTHNFTRNVVWTFENLQMLIGTDMPIFGGQTHPCISLRLRDMNKPINVLTGIDYWLDNLMSNVPEVVMCYHLDGIVQKYELIKTEDLPNLDDAEFSPRVIRDIAQNILSFLKNNATKAGHTYWLFKGKDDDVVKLYDLTSLCTEIPNEPDREKGQNPFTVPVAMLLYRVARNMKYSMDRPTRGHRGTIRMLLKNCIQLLNREKYPQIVTSAHYMLSDLYIPADTDPAKPIFVEDEYQDDPASDYASNSSTQDVNDSSPPPNSSEDGNEEHEENDDGASATASVKLLTLAHVKDQPDQEESKYKPPPISGTVVERCKIALNHVYNGLQCLVFFPTAPVDTSNIYDEKSEDQQHSSLDSSFTQSQEEHQNMAKPFEAIPMPYYTLDPNPQVPESRVHGEVSSPSTRKKNQKKKSRKGDNSNNKQLVVDDKSTRKALLLCQKSKVETLPTWEAPKKTDNRSWKAHLKALLYEKAALIFAVLAEFEYSSPQCNYGASLRYIRNVLKCQRILEIFCDIKNDKSISYLLGRAGDCCLMAVQDWRNIEKHRDEFEIKDETEGNVVGEIASMKDIDIGAECCSGALGSIEDCLLASYKCYEKALSLVLQDVERTNLLRRVGNIHNELGVLYMNQASAKCQQSEETGGEGKSSKGSVDISWLLTESLSHLEAGIKAFESVCDEANLALLHSNKGRLMRLCAHINVDKRIQERNFYNKALVSYQRALQVLGVRKTNPAIWDTVNWDLSTTLFTMATLLQDYPTIEANSEEELEREVVEILHKALKHCDTDTPGAKQPVYQFRVATIHHRVGSLYHRIYRRLEADSDSLKRKTTLQLTKIHYEKAGKLFLLLEQPVEFLTVQLERVALAEYQAQIATLFQNKLKAHQYALDCILQCREMLEKKKEIAVTHSEKGTASCDNNVEELDQSQEEENLMSLLEQRLQYCLKSLTKLCLGRNTKQHQLLADVYKRCYSQSLEKLGDKPTAHCTVRLLQHLSEILSQIHDPLLW